MRGFQWEWILSQKKITEYNGGLVEIKAHMRAKLCPHMEDSFLFFFQGRFTTI